MPDGQLNLAGQLITHLICSQIVFRAVLKKGWLDDEGKITSTAFMRDPKRDLDGLSVNIAAETDLNLWLDNFNATFGADSLHCGRVRDLGLEIGQTEDDLRADPAHALVVGLPFADDDPKKAEDLATALQKLCRIVERRRRRK